MLSELRLASFKSFATPQFAPLAPITLIYGPNSGGKSSIIQSLLLIKQSLVTSRSSLNTLDFNGYLTDLGDFNNAVFRHEKRSIELGFSYNTNFMRGEATYTLPPADDSRAIDFRFAPMTELIRTPNRQRKRRYIGLENCSYRLGTPTKSDSVKGFQFGFENADSHARQLGLRYRRDREHHFFRASKNTDLDEVANYLLRFFGHELSRVESELPRQTLSREISHHARRRALKQILSDSLFTTSDFLPSSLYRLRPLSENEPREFSDEEVQQTYLAERYGLRIDFLSRFVDEIRFMISQVSYIGPFRRPPDRIEILRDRDTDSVGRAGEFFHYMLFGKDPTSSQLNSWLKKLNVPYILELVRAGVEDGSALVGNVVQIRYRDNRLNTNVSATDIGYGVGQIIPIIVEGILSQNKMILVEQPELHLHPKLQADFADLLICTSFSESNPEGNQWIVETHSELVLLRILRRIRNGELDAHQVKVLYVDPPSASNAAMPGSQIFDIELSADGRFLVPWPQGFFDEQGAETFGGEQ